MNVPDARHWAALQPRLDELLALSPAEREHHLLALAANDAAGAGELRVLLAARDSASQAGFLQAPIDAALLPAAPPGPASGQRLGAWTLVDLLGEGGMGSVWRARRSDGRFEGEAAVKLLRNGLFDPLAQERFRREGAILAQLRHPGIAQLLDAGITPQGQPFLVLELVPGERIDRWCDAAGLHVRQRVELFVQVVDAVAAAHAQLVIHRDLKPSNVLVDRAGRVRLVDFGIARLVDDGTGGEAATLTLEGRFVLTPAYAAPEQFQGGPLSAATDVYALGVLLYELLTGAHPSGLAPTADPLAWLQAALAGPARLASVAAPQRRRELQGDLDTLLSKATAADPAARYATAAALRDDLQRHLNNEPIAARPASAAYRLGKLVRRRPFECAVVAAVVLAVPAGAYVQVAVLLSLALGTGVALWQMRRAQRQTVLARQEQQRAEAVKQFIAAAFGQAVPREGSGGVVTAADLLHAAHARVQSELRGHSPLAAELLAIIGNSFMELDDLAGARKVMADAVGPCEAAFGRLHPITLHARTGLVHARLISGELEAAGRLLPVLLADLRSAMPATAADLANALQLHSFVLAKRGDTEGSLAALREALVLAREHCGPTHRATLSTAGLLGNTLNSFGRSAESLAVLEPAVEVARAAFGDRRPHVELARLEGFLGTTLSSLGRLAEAEALLRQSLHDLWRLDGRDTERNRYVRGVLELLLRSRGDLPAAIEQIRDAIAADRRVNETPTVETAALTEQLGWMLCEAGRFEEGFAAFEQSRDIVRATVGMPKGHAAHRSATRLAHCLLLAGRPEEALAGVLPVLEDAGSSQPVFIAWAACVRVGALRALGRLDEAETHVPTMLEIAERVPGGGAVTRADLELAELRLAQGRGREGAPHVRRALEQLEPRQVPQSPLLRRARELLAACEQAG